MRNKTRRPPAQRYKHHFRVRSKIKQHRQDKFKGFFKFSLIFIVIVVVFSFAGLKALRYVNSSDTFKLKEIRIEGLKSIPEDEFIAVLGLKNGDNLLSTYFGKLGSSFKSKLPFIKSVKIHRRFPDKITFSVVEREPIAWSKLNGDIYFVDNENVSFKIDKSTLTLPMVEADSMESRIPVRLKNNYYPPV